MANWSVSRECSAMSDRTGGLRDSQPTRSLDAALNDASTFVDPSADLDGGGLGGPSSPLFDGRGSARGGSSREDRLLGVFKTAEARLERLVHLMGYVPGNADFHSFPDLTGGAVSKQDMVFKISYAL